MSEFDASPLRALSEMAETLRQLGIDFSVVGGLAVSVRGEVRTTRDVDIAITIDQRGLEDLIVELRQRGYDIYKLVEHETAGRTATVRLFAPSGVLVDIIAASSGIEADIVAAATSITMESLGPVKVACAEDLLAMKVLSLSPRRPQDAVDAQVLLRANPDLDLSRVRMLLERIRERGYSRGQDLFGKLEQVMAAAGYDGESPRGA